VLCGLYEELDAHHREALPDLFAAPPEPGRTRDFVTALIDEDDSAILVAEDRSGALLGFVTIILRTVTASTVRRARRFGEIDNIVVRAGARRRGVARSLLDEAARWSAARGHATLELSVYAFNKEAIGFYRAAGFETLSHRMSLALQGPDPEREPTGSSR
jgi:ribosomal protein S18 acetylase RimI-like enzyme